MHLASSSTCYSGRRFRQSIIHACWQAHARPLLPSQVSLGRKEQRKRFRLRGFGDDLLDYITAGPKLRKWYGEGERMPTDGGGPDLGGEADSTEPEDDGVRDAILVTDADSPTAEQVVLQLILARAKVRALVKSAAAAGTSYGSYVTPIEGNAGDARALESALRGARAVICTGRLGALLPLCQQRKIGHLILLTSDGSSGGGGFSLGAFLDGKGAAQHDAAREAAARRSGVPCTLVRAGRILDGPGGSQRLVISQEDPPSRPLGDITREDVARVLVQCLERRPAGTLCFSVAASGSEPAASEPDLDLAEQLARLQESASITSVN